jgi:hypothetical protein
MNEIISKDCFKDITIEGQLYQILLAVEGIAGSGTLLAQANS